MNIVLEGADNSGKSTLAKYIAEQLLLPIVHSGGPEKFPGEVIERTKKRLTIVGPMLHDRHPVVSQNIHLTALRLPGTYIPEDLVAQFYESKPLIIYCRNAGTLDGHQMSEHASPEYHRRVERYFPDLCRMYDEWALHHANITYRIGDDMSNVVRMVRAYMNDDVLRLVDALKEMYRFDPVRDVEEFHKKFKIDYNGKPRLLPERLSQFRISFMAEEISEYRQKTSNELTTTQSLEGMLDALVDLVYVTLGTSHLHGFNFREAWRRVHDANMRKVRAQVGRVGPRGNHEFDVIKPEGWTAPSHADLVQDHEDAA